MTVKQSMNIQTLRALNTRFERSLDNLAETTTMIGVCQYMAECHLCINLICTLDLTIPYLDDEFSYDEPWNMRSRLDSVSGKRRAALQSGGNCLVWLDASSPAALSATVDRLREWMREHEVAHVTIMPKDVATMGVDADTASQRMWDAAPKVITELRFEAAVVTQSNPAKREWVTIHLGTHTNCGGKIFHFGCNKYATADDFIRAHQRDNSPQPWFIDSPAPMAPRGWDVAETDHD